ncbi:hypothetical protein TrLO_g1680 [Triparma laevis f. longispina]|uniref:EF-hand domain-containing protein n=1 Tax=Triparma laevis f. longispina TaxID=1714387 RepID=A0A9W7AK59_9STRA|nr:hypothetical protein TrLO_g1680 [Triparma laevis f. longispina]
MSAYMDEMDSGVAFIVSKLKKELASRGAKGIVGMGRKFKIMDDDGSGALNMSEFKKCMKEMNMDLTDVELRKLFEHFDADQGGSIGYEEFIQGVRDPLTPRRLALVQLAFAKIDRDGSGEVEPAEVVGAYNADKHPDVISGKKTADEVLREFLDTFDVGGVKDGKVTRKEFENYYTNLGANIDNEDYFELMIRNAWHIAGGEGASASSANKRVLVTLANGKQEVVEIENDLGLDLIPEEGGKRQAEIMRRLRQQGIHVMGIDAKGSVDDAQRGGKKINKNNPTFTSSISLSGVGEAPGKNRVGKPTPKGARKGNVAADHVDIHHSDLKSSLGFVAKKKKAAAPAQHMSLAQVAGTGNVTHIIERLKKQLASRGARGIIGLGRKFKIMDDSGNGALSPEEFKKAMAECALDLSESEVMSLFKYFDKDGSGDIGFEEFLGGVRGAMNPRRMTFVHQAFDIIDADGNGFVEPSDIVEAYNAKKHPDVQSGKKTEEEVLREFLDTFDVGGEKDGCVTKTEFENYYKNVSASVDNDDYFELMMRNAWHISGGEGWCANSANKRVLVTDSSGKQSVVEIEQDLGLDLIEDPKAQQKEMMRRLKKQGVDVVKLDTSGSTEEESGKKVNRNFAIGSNVFN